MSRNLFAVVGALAALAILLSSSFLMTASAVSPNVYNANHTITVETGQALDVDILPYFPEEVRNPDGTTYPLYTTWGEGGQKTPFSPGFSVHFMCVPFCKPVIRFARGEPVH